MTYHIVKLKFKSNLYLNYYMARNYTLGNNRAELEPKATVISVTTTRNNRIQITHLLVDDAARWTWGWHAKHFAFCLLLYYNKNCLILVETFK